MERFSESMLRVFFTISLVVMLTACSGTPSKETVVSSIKKIMPPSFEVIEVKPLKEVPGLLEVTVRMENQTVILYMDKKAKYVISGSLLEVDTKKNLTIEALNKFKSK
jgi:hypothetical protein